MEKPSSFKKQFKVGGYEPEKERIKRNILESQKLYNNKEAYNEEDPVKKKDWYRTVDPGKWMGVGSFRYAARTENERIIKEIKYQASMIDNSVYLFMIILNLTEV